MQVKEITDQKQWDDFVGSFSPNTFLQSWQWKLVQEEDGEIVTMLGFYTNEVLVAVALLILVHAKRGNYYLIPHGPIVKNDADYKEVIEMAREYCAQHANINNSVALRIAPLVVQDSLHDNIFSSLNFRPAPMHVHAELTWVVDISKSEDEIVAGMRKTTRHAIKKAEKDGVEVDIISDSSALERFWPLYEQTTSRHGFVAFTKKLIALQAAIFGDTNMFFAIAKYNGKDVAGAMLMQYGDTVFYYHGASVKTTVPAAQLLQWRAMQEAKKRGMKRYNFWGIARDDEPNHPFAGITIFKKGFGGYAINYMHAQDYVLDWKYWILCAIEMYRKKKRGF
jgi:peptidoglycan pentaglycine glycine transferase (the first glycine)